MLGMGPARSAFLDRLAIPSLLRRIVATGLDLPIAEDDVADIGRVVIDAAAGAAMGGIPLDLEHVDLAVAYLVRAEKIAVRETERDPRQARLRAEQRQEQEF